MERLENAYNLIGGVANADFFRSPLLAPESESIVSNSEYFHRAFVDADDLHSRGLGSRFELASRAAIGVKDRTCK